MAPDKAGIIYKIVASVRSMVGRIRARFSREGEFPYPKINRPQALDDAEINKKISECFDSLDGYIENVKPFIYNNIQLAYPEYDERINLSRFQHLLSSTLLRSLYIRNGIVDGIKSRNLVSVFNNTKSFLEVPAFLAYVLSVIKRDIQPEETLEILAKIAMGNKGEGELRVGTQETVSVLTMFEKLESYMEEISSESKNDFKINKVMSEFYGLVCNACHPNYDAHDLTGDFDTDEGKWMVRSPAEIKSKIVTDIAWYAPPLVTCTLIIEALASSIYNHPKISKFNKLTSPLLFVD